jgi:hypothetical protein
MRISKAVVAVAAALCFGLAIGGSILLVGWQFHPPSHAEKIEVKVAGRPAFVQEEPESYLEKLVDPIFLVTGPLALFTYRLFKSTADLARDTRKASKKALAASTKATETLARIERPYVTAGGEYLRTPNGYIYIDGAGKRFFRFELGNYGKTAAVLTAFSVRFDTLANVRRRSSDVSRDDYPFHDLLAPGVRHKVIKDDIEIAVDINSGANVVYGACWYQSALQADDHIACFALKLLRDGTSIDADILGLDPSYRHWD